MSTRYKNARTLDGRDIGRFIEQTDTDWKSAVYDRELSEWTVPPITEKRWFPILMITHKKNGDVRIRTPRGGDVEFTGTTEVMLRDELP